MEAFQFSRNVWKCLGLYNEKSEYFLTKSLYKVNFVVVVLGIISFIGLSSLYLVDFFNGKSEMNNQFVLYILMQISLDLPPLGTLICAMIGKEDIKSLIKSIENILRKSE